VPRAAAIGSSRVVCLHSAEPIPAEKPAHTVYRTPLGHGAAGYSGYGSRPLTGRAIEEVGW
jgi:hypothetical protein